MTASQHFIAIEMPRGVRYEVVTKDSLDGWSAANCAASRSFGSRWFEDRRSAILLVPSVVTRLDANIIVNLEHPDARSIEPGPGATGSVRRAPLRGRELRTRSATDERHTVPLINEA